MPRITVTTHYDVEYYVVHRTAEEGGMRSGQFGGRCDSLEAALLLMDQAQVVEPKEDWEILVQVERHTDKQPMPPRSR